MSDLKEVVHRETITADAWRLKATSFFVTTLLPSSTWLSYFGHIGKLLFRNHICLLVDPVSEENTKIQVHKAGNASMSSEKFCRNGLNNEWKWSWATDLHVTVNIALPWKGGTGILQDLRYSSVSSYCVIDNILQSIRNGPPSDLCSIRDVIVRLPSEIFFMKSENVMLLREEKDRQRNLR